MGNHVKYRFGFVMEQTLGHVTHYRNFRAAVGMDPAVTPTWLPLAFEPRGTLEGMPAIRGNWSARASLRASRLLAEQQAATQFDALLFHTQVTTLLSAGLMRQVPTVISLDATPANYDSVGAAYGHRRGGYLAETVKRVLNRRPLHAALALVTWCGWARHSLIEDYGIPADRITVIPPGVQLDRWPDPGPRTNNRPLRLLFVGGDFERKGGADLLRAFLTLPAGTELHLVTKAEIAGAPGVYVHRDLAPNSDELMTLYAQADVFVLPTHADCFPLVIQEAMATGLPVVATDVGAIAEAVEHERTGLLVPPRDISALSQALTTLLSDSGRRLAMGSQGRMEAERRFDSAANAGKVIEIMKQLADRQGPRRAASRGGSQVG